jgi:hypothetical protein
MGEAHLNSTVGDSSWLIFVGVRIGDGTTRTDDVLAEVLDFLVSVSTQVINCSDALGYYCSAKVPSKVKRVPQVIDKGSRRVHCRCSLVSNSRIATSCDSRVSCCYFFLLFFRFLLL